MLLLFSILRDSVVMKDKIKLTICVKEKDSHLINALKYIVSNANHV